MGKMGEEKIDVSVVGKSLGFRTMRVDREYFLDKK